MKITFLLPNMGNTGGPQSIYAHMENLKKAGHEVYLVTTQYCIPWEVGYQKDLLNYLQSSKPTNSSNPFPLKITSAKTGHSGKQPLLESIDPLIRSYWANYPISDTERSDEFIIATAFTTAIPAAFISHQLSITGAYYAQHWEFIMTGSPLEQWICKLSYGLPLHIIANSKWLASLIVNHYHRDVFTISHAAHNPDLFDCEEHFSKFDTADPIRIISYCDAREFKNFNALGDAMLMLNKNFPGKFVWSTYGNSTPAETYPVNHYGRVTHEHLGAILRDNHVYISPSIAESWPIQPMEAALAGCCIVHTPIGTEDFLNNDNAIIIEPTVESIYNALADLIDAPDKSKAKEKATKTYKLKEYTWEVSTNKLIGLLTSLIDHDPYYKLESSL